jgi:hypothetical protein
MMLTPTPVNKTEVPQDLLNIEDRQRTNLVPWNGQFSPQLIQVLLERYAERGMVVFDPFVGSGTLLHECGRLGLSAFGSEINPAAFSLAKIYELINVRPRQRVREVSALGSFLPQTSCSGVLFPDQGFDSYAGLAGQSGSFSPIQRVLFDALTILLDLNEPLLPQRKLFNTWRKLRSIVDVLPHSENRIKVLNVDARQVPIQKASVDLVITSPPYINVFNYHQQYRKSAETLGWNLLSVARSEIGSNRKHRANRFLTVIQYCLDIAETFQEIRRVCKSNARIIFVVGRQSSVRGTAFYNAQIVGEIATKCADLRLVIRQERVFTNRFGARIFEDILHFVPNESRQPRQTTPERVAREVARQFLEAAARNASSDVAPDIGSAIFQIENVASSPLFATNFARSAAANAVAPSR